MAVNFDSFFMAGFECSSHRRRDGVRLDLIRATAHDRHALEDYRLCKRYGFGTLRDGLRWHRIEKSPGQYDWSCWMPMLEAAEEAGVQVIWDLFHYGSPDCLDQGASDFPERFTHFALAALEVQQSVSDRPPLVCPLNEINFLSWAVDDGYFPPVGPGERGWFKQQLVRTAIASAKAIKQRWPRATIIWAEPLIHIAPHDGRRESVRGAERNLKGMYEAYDWITGRAKPELGGDPSFVDVIGLNFYPHNQWYWNGPTIPMGHHEYRPLADMLIEMADRYDKPIMLSETGAEGSGKPSWLHYVCNEVRHAVSRGADVRGTCWYPITAYPGWDNSRHAETGLFSSVVADGSRHVDERLLAEFELQRRQFDELEAQRTRRAPRPRAVA
ncbi:beta-glucosidase [Sphingomonas segetis]|jgi:beta-glucosidase/6-phospho-beta-glucosidase/beta-galactosidase|uniref:beta-glucosidase n=1 Tax=Sphingomonas segetis TaxID=1104779 RepID=UPI0012D3284E|nr:beta-glucosidase [Sphingomonas segetis]